MFKKIAEFFKVKAEAAMIKNTSIEEQYQAASLQIIDEIKRLKVRHATSKLNVTKFTKLAEEKDEARAKVDKEIIHLRKTSPETDVSTRIKLALLHKHSASNYRNQVEEEKAMQLEIEASVRKLDDTKDDLAIRLELIRATEAAREQGMENVAEIVHFTDIAQINVESTLDKVRVLKGDDQTSVSIGSADLADYLAELEAKA